MKIFLVGFSMGFPNGAGEVARMRAYATGFRNSGVEVEVLCLVPSEATSGPVANPDSSGELDGVPFRYTCGTSRRSKSRLMNRLLFLKGLLVAARIIAVARRDGDRTAILASPGDSSLSLFALWGLSRTTGSLLIGERTEYPFIYRRRTLGTMIEGLLNNAVLYRRLHGLVVISRVLLSHFRSLLGKDFPILLVPILVDLSKFGGIVTAVPRKVITYCGNLDHEDEVENLLLSFSQATKDENEWQLQVVGPGRSARVQKLTEIARGSNVQFTGPVAADRIPRLLAESAVLVLPRKKALFSEAGFPTKLGEYLASGRPVVVTATGEIPRYLSDGENAYLVHSDAPERFAEKLRYVIEHMDEAEQVGKRGITIAKDCFETNSQCARFLQWLEESVLGSSRETESTPAMIAHKVGPAD